MKRCPECSFLYEEEQQKCDMDGVPLIHDEGPFAFDNEPTIQSGSLALMRIAPNQTYPFFAQIADWKNLAAACVLGLLLGSVVAVYYTSSQPPVADLGSIPQITVQDIQPVRAVPNVAEQAIEQSSSTAEPAKAYSHANEDRIAVATRTKPPTLLNATTLKARESTKPKLTIQVVNVPRARQQKPNSKLGSLFKKTKSALKKIVN